MIEQPRYVLLQIAPVVFENHQRVLTASDQEIEKGGGAVEGISQQQVECAWISRDYSGQ